jgi:hypothetical protein
LDFQFRGNVVSLVTELCQVRTGHRIYQVFLIPVEYGRGRLEHLIISSGGKSRAGILLVNGHVGHLFISNGQQVIIILLVVRVSHGKVRRNLDTVAHVIVQSQTSGQAVQFLLDDGTSLMVIPSRYPESGLLASSGYRNVMVLPQSPLGHFILPIGIIIVLFILRKGRVVVQFRDVGSRRALLRIEITFFQQHRVLIARQHLIAFRLVSPRKTQGITYGRCSPFTAFGLDFDDSVGTLRAVNSRGSSILQHTDFLYVFGIDVQQLSKGFIVGTVDVERAHVHVPRVTVHDNKGVLVGQRTDGGRSAQTHRGPASQITRIGNDVKPGDTSLQSFIDSRNAQPLEFFCGYGLGSKADFPFRNSKPPAVQTFLGYDRHLFHYTLCRFQRNVVHRTVYGERLRLISHKTDFQLILRALHLHGKMAVEIRNRSVDVTPRGIHLTHRRPYQCFHLIPYRTAHGRYLGMNRTDHKPEP